MVRGFARVLVIAGAWAVTTSAAATLTQFTPMTTGALLEGNWQSCREADGHYGERIYDNTLPGIGPFELHLGPYHEFALFRGIQDEHRDHRSRENLLQPHNVEVRANRAAQAWDAAGLRFEVALGGGARSECESWFVVLRRAGGRSSDN